MSPWMSTRSHLEREPRGTGRADCQLKKARWARGSSRILARKPPTPRIYIYRERQKESQEEAQNGEGTNALRSGDEVQTRKRARVRAEGAPCRGLCGANGNKRRNKRTVVEGEEVAERRSSEEGGGRKEFKRDGVPRRHNKLCPTRGGGGNN